MLPNLGEGRDGARAPPPQRRSVRCAHQAAFFCVAAGGHPVPGCFVLPAFQPVRAKQKKVVPGWGPGRSSLRLSGPLVAHFAFCRAADRAARPLRRAGPAAKRPPGHPPGFIARPLCALRAPWRSLAPQSLSLAIRSAAGALRLPLLRSGAGSVPCVARRVPPAPSLRALGPGGSSPGGIAALRPLFLPAPRGFCARVPRPLRFSRAVSLSASIRRHKAVRLPPAPLPSPPPPPGAPGERRAVPAGPRPPTPYMARAPLGALGSVPVQPCVLPLFCSRQDQAYGAPLQRCDLDCCIIFSRKA